MYTKLSTTKPIANKEHKCELCSKTIYKGLSYDREVGVFDNEFQSIKLHIGCRRLCDLLSRSL